MVNILSSLNEDSINLLQHHVNHNFNSTPYNKQLKLTDSVCRTIEDGTNLIAKAGTGFGKTLAYLIPAITSGKKVVISTSTLTLLNQLDSEVLPLLLKTFQEQNRSFSWSVAKGRAQYLCLDKFNRLNPVETLPYAKFFNDESFLGDRNQLFVNDDDTWDNLSAGADECIGRNQCSFGSNCFYERAKNLRSDVDLLLTTHALYSKELLSPSNVLPAHDLVVFDECHDLPRYLHDAFSTKITEKELVRYLKQCHKYLIPTDSLELIIENLYSYKDQYPNQIQSSSSASDLSSILESLQIELAAILSTILDGSNQRIKHLTEQILYKIEALLYINRNEILLTGEEDSDVILHTILRNLPVEVSNYWEGKTVVFTSATIPFEFAKSIVLKELTYSELDFGSEIDYSNKALLYIPKDLSNRNSNYRELLNQELISLIKVNPGRTLMLFTSHTAMESAYKFIKENTPLQPLMQGKLPREDILNNFKSQSDSILLGTNSFWQGIDLSVAPCSMVIIDKIPFPRPDDHRINLLKEKWGEYAFHMVDIPHAALLLEQGMGRLLRNKNDKGVIAILDSRLSDSNYSHYFKMLLPNIPSASAFDHIKSFLS